MLKKLKRKAELDIIRSAPSGKIPVDEAMPGTVPLNTGRAAQVEHTPVEVEQTEGVNMVSGKRSDFEIKKLAIRR